MPRLLRINGAWTLWFPRVKIRLLTPEEINRFDPNGLAFLNINTPEDFAQAEQRVLANDQHWARCVADFL